MAQSVKKIFNTIKNKSNKRFTIINNILNNISNSSNKNQLSQSGSIAKERLQIILAHQRGTEILNNVNMKELQRELLLCIERHIRVSKVADVKMTVKQEGTLDIFEMQVPVETMMKNKRLNNNEI